MLCALNDPLIAAVRDPVIRRGATMVELLVALVLFDMSLLSFIAMCAAAAQHAGEAGRRNRAAIAASSRIEALASQSCGAPVSVGDGTLERGVSEHWMAFPITNGREIVDSISIDDRFPDRIVLRARTAC